MVLTLSYTHLYWLAQLFGWSFYLLAMYGVNYLRLQSEGQNGTPGALPYLLIGSLGLLLTHMFRNWAIKGRWTRLPISKQLGLVVLAALLLALCHNLLFYSLLYLPYREAFSLNTVELLVNYVNLSAVFLLWLLLYVGYKYFVNYKQEEIARLRQQAMRQQMELHVLRSQINPHFLFNALNGIRALVTESPVQAQQAVTQLARLLRKLLSAEQDACIPLGEELALVRDYLAIEQIRYEERLQVSVTAPDELNNLPVPALGVLTLVENAIKHGIAKTVGGGLLQICVSTNNNQLIVSVLNPGSLTDGSDSAGMGLKNTRQRLSLLYGSEASLRLSSPSAQTVCATLSLPLQPHAFPPSLSA